MDRFEEVREQVRDRADLVALVEEYVHLKAHGRYHMGLCPFHQEKTPSFAVYTDKQYFHCYGCGKAGDVFSFLMERDGVGFREALETLADRYGISTEGAFGGRGQQGPREDVYGTLSKVRDWFRYVLQTAEGAGAREYLEHRGMSAAIESFGLGFHPSGGRLRAYVEEQKLSRQVLEQAGLLGGDGYERFAGRLMFPIEDERGRVVGFGGRILVTGEEKAKYLNSPESPFFTKRKLLFGLRKAKQANDRKLVVMEGYTDVIAAHLAGLTGAVASLGTALTTDHARLLSRFATDGVVLLFDGDRAGRLAADRAFRELVHTQLPVRIALLDEGTDPADLVSELPDRSPEEVNAGRDRLREILASAEDSLTVWFRLQRLRFDLTLDVNVERVTGECARILATVADPVRREALGRRMAQHLGVGEAVFLRTVSKIRPRGRPERQQAPGRASSRVDRAAAGGPEEAALEATEGGESQDFEIDADTWEQAAPGAVTRPPRPLPTGAVADAELDLLACVLSAPELLKKLETLDVTLPQVREVLEFARSGLSEGSSDKDQIVRYLFMRCVERPELSQLVARCLDRAEHFKDPLDTFSQLQMDQLAFATKAKAQRIRYELQQARAQGDTARVNQLTQEYLQQLRSRGQSSPESPEESA
ncbi:MAG: DNA primase [Planctomycetota bacterium]|nr:DNA primase [Planctomycetota bacterium]